MHMKNNEKITDYFTRLGTFTNQINTYGEEVTKQMMVEKVL